MKNGYRLVDLNEPFDSRELVNINKFSNHFCEFWENFDDLRQNGFEISWNFRLLDDGRVHSKGLTVSRHRLKGLFLDYRTFHHQDEPIQIRRIANVLKRKCRDPEFLAVIDENLRRWDQSEHPIVGWHNDFQVEDVIETLFDEELFHAGTARRSRYSLEEIKAKFSGEALLMAATLIVYDRLLVVRNINWILKPALSGSDTLRVPLTD